MKKEIISEIILGTGNYENVRSGNTVSITGDGGNAWGYFGPSYKPLAPRLKTYMHYAVDYQRLEDLKESKDEYLTFRKKIEDQYIKEYYETRLRNLDVEELLLYFKEKYVQILFLVKKFLKTVNLYVLAKVMYIEALQQ